MPVETNRGETFFWFDGHFWELANWIPGRADFHDDPTEAKLSAAMQALAEFHQAVANHPSAPSEPAVSPGLQQRMRQLQLLQRGGIEQLRSAVEDQIDPQFGAIVRRMLKWLPEATSHANRVAQSAPNVAVPLQPAIRDIWHDHVHFQGEQVTGIVDFGSMRIESVSGDIARLLGSLLRQGLSGWSGGLAVYEKIRPLSSVERALLPVFDSTSIVLSAANWLSWLFLERRAFDDSEAVSRRLHEVESRLASFVEGGDVSNS